MVALFFLLRVPYWFAVGLAKKNQRPKAVEQAITYLIGCWYSLTNWKKLLMNRELVAAEL